MALNMFHRRSSPRAQTLVEFALVMPILLAIVFGLLEVGRLILTYSIVFSASREAVRYGSASGMVGGQPQYKNCIGIRDAAQNVNFLGSFNKDVDIDILYSTGDHISFGTPVCPLPSSLLDVPSGGWIEVSVRATFTPIIRDIAGIHLFDTIYPSSKNRRTIIGSVQILP